MAPAAAAPAAANRRARNITESASPTPFQTASPEPGPSRTGRKRPRPSYAEADDDDDDGDDDDDDNEEVEEDEQDGEGEEVVDIEEEEEDGEGEAEVEEVEDDEVSEEDAMAMGRSGVSSQVVSDDLDQAPSPSPEPILLPRRSGGSMKIRLNLGNGPLSNPDRGQRAAAKKAGKKTKKVALDALASDNEDEAMLDEDDIGSDVDMGEEASTRSGSPSKLTARQRAMGNKNNKELHDSLLALHYADAGAGGKKLELSEAERLQKREEMARRRKRQNDQRLQDEQDQTINRLLRAQTGRSRAKLDAPTADPSAATSRMPSPSVRARRHADTLRWTCRLVHGRMDVRVGVPSGKEAWISLTSTEPTGKRDASGVCAVEGCGKGRKYRCVRDFERGGCSMEHLKLVEASLKV